MALAFDSFMKGAIGSQNLRDNQTRLDQNQQVIDLQEEERQFQRNQQTANSMAVLARQLDITDDAGMSINKDKLGKLLQGQRDSGNFDPKVQQLVSLLGNEDLAAKQNPGFEFKGLTVGPGGTLTLQGGYEGDDKTRYATVGRQSGDDAPVAFSSVEDVVGLIEGQYNQQWTKPGVGDLYNEMTLRDGIRTAGNELTANEPKLKIAVSTLTNELEDAIAATAPNPEKAAEIVTNLKTELANQPYHIKLKVLQDYGSRLQIPSVESVMTPEVEEAVQAAEAAEQDGAPDNSARIAEIEQQLKDRSYVSGLQGAKSVAAKEAELKAELAKLKGTPDAEQNKPKPTATQNQINRTKAQLQRSKREVEKLTKNNASQADIDAANARVKTLQSKLDTQQGVSEPIEDKNPLIQEAAVTASNLSDEDIIEGNVSFSADQIAALQARLQEKGIVDMAEAYKLTKAEQQQMRGMIGVLAKDKETRRDYIERFNNVIATNNPDYNTKTLQEAQVAQQNANSSTDTAKTGRLNYFQKIDDFDFNVSEKLGGRIRDVFDQARGAIYGKNSDGSFNEDIDFDEQRFFSEYGGAGGAFNQMYTEYRNAKTPEAKAQTRLALNSMISMGLQALAESEEYGSFGENFIPDGGIDHIGSNDVYLDRLRILPNGAIAVVDLNTGKQLDETVPESVARKLFGETAWAYVKREIKGGPESARGQAKQGQK